MIGIAHLYGGFVKPPHTLTAQAHKPGWIVWIVPIRWQAPPMSAKSALYTRRKV